jgi:lysozyme
MTMIKPLSRPQRSRGAVEQLIRAAGVGQKHKVVLVGVRGYYLDTMGVRGKNDRRIYDDAIFLLSPTAFVAFNANVDPGAFAKGIANLKAGVWLYKLGIHGLSKPKNQRYEALVQAAKVTVHRDQVGDDTGFFGINIHRGRVSKVSSLGCQTIVPEQWSEFIGLVKSELRLHGQEVVPYVLVEQKPG